MFPEVMMKKKITKAVFIIIRFFIKIFYPEITFRGTENLPDEPFIAVGNHAKMNGPIACELYFPGDHYTWTAGEMMHLREVPDYSYRDFWGEKPACIKWAYRLLSYIIAPFSVCIFNNAKCIGVYHDTRLISTFRDTVRRLQDGAGIVIFPEHNVPYNNIVWDFQERFVDVAKMYYRKTGKEICFVPMYTAPRLKSVYFGEPVRYDHNAPAEQERDRICNAMMNRITDIAENLPEHTIVPYPNMPERNYPKNTDRKKAYQNEIPQAREHGFGRAKTLFRKPVVDYREFRLSRLNEPEFSHIKLLGGWLVYLAFYFITENLIPLSECHVIHCALDDIIPFNEWFLLFYCFWYVLLVLSLLYFFLYDISSFRKLQIFIMITQAVAMTVYIIYPSIQLGRPDVMPRDNFLCDLMAFIYAFDTPTGVCPSLHVAYSMGIASVWCKYRRASNKWKIFVVISTILISVSVVFVKQHSAVDIAAALPVGILAEYLVYGRQHAARRRLLRRKARRFALRFQILR